MRLVIVGGSDAGISAALRARELDPGASVTILLADEFPNFSICGLPYFLSGETPDWRHLAHRKDFPGIEILRGHVVVSVDPTLKEVVASHNGQNRRLHYDRLILATGASPVRPALPGATLPGVRLLHSMADAFAVHEMLETRPARAVIVGAGYIGLEMAEAFHRRGCQVTLLSRATTVMPSVDPEFGTRIGTMLRTKGIEVVTDETVSRIETNLTVVGQDDSAYPAELVLLATGVRPNTDLYTAAGGMLGAGDAIPVDDRMRTALPDIFAAGDCVITRHRLKRADSWLSLGTIAHKQGRVAGENAVGGDRSFAGVVGTQSLKLFNLVIARSGLSEAEALAEGFDPLTVESDVDDHKAYYPGSGRLTLRMMGDRHSGRLLGAQIIGPVGAEVSKRIDIVAAALFAGADVEALNDYDLSYTPPLSSPWDPVQIAAQAWSLAVRKYRG